ncbi:MAG: hypothetical protein ABEI58_04105 [Candidatus Nanohaloarchaea archaeon]
MRKYIGAAIAIAFLLFIINATIKMQMQSIENAAEFSQGQVSDHIEIAAGTLHVLKNENTESFGVYQQSAYQDLIDSCGSNSGVQGFTSNGLALWGQEASSSDSSDSSGGSSGTSYRGSRSYYYRGAYDAQGRETGCLAELQDEGRIMLGVTVKNSGTEDLRAVEVGKRP